jgi:cobalt-precorrin 5A hydrolase
MNQFYAAGFGCRRGCSEASLQRLMERSLKAAGLSTDQIVAFASIDKKRDEPGLLALSKTLDKPLYFYSSVQLSTYDHAISQISDLALKQTGSVSVAEAAALACIESLHEGCHGDLAISKRSNGEATFALAKVTQSNQP